MNMMEKIKLVGECPIGKLYKKIKIDMFGFIFSVEYFKELNPTYKTYTTFSDLYGVEDYTYSDVVYYNRRDENGVTIYEKLIKNPKSLKDIRAAYGVCSA